ncbi:hypothetical protein, conserved [Plasmodium gonderi]|uniref:Uncharacterized protein n=1 Tax=Plasmodium gonderi TaxID=77519 RepID=A0A1Y1JJW7_PLAGO|nr:hypothetical protein, conserved [Plasmodium gonderi]GAW81082.1 hypothetical protein, conserved [Plasmodium gonderi]
MDGTYGMRTVLNSSRLAEEKKYDMNTTDLGHGSMNTNYMMNGTVLTNGYNNSGDYMINREKYPADMIPQFKLDQGLNTYNNTMPMNSVIHADPNDSLSMQGMKTCLETTTGFDSYRNLMNYNNTQNTIQPNQIPINLDDYNTAGDLMYMNQNAGDNFPPEYVNNLRTTDTDHMIYSNNFKVPNGNFNTMMPNNNYNNLPYSMPIFENMNNPQMFMQQMNQKQPMSGLTPQMEHTCSIRKMPAVNKRKIKPKKFFPCC